MDLPKAKHPVAGFNPEDDQAFAKLQALRASTFVACSSPDAAAEVARYGKRVLDWAAEPSGRADEMTALSVTALRAYRRLQRPLVSIVTILYNKARGTPGGPRVL